MFRKILIANRGEIAVRIIRSCKEMGIATVAVYSTADAEALHTALADERVCIGGPDASDSYLNQERILSAALATGASAIHPGYGFLSENPEFAQACRKNGIVFIGPTRENMERLSDKAVIKALMEEAGLPTIPGTGVLESSGEAKGEAMRIGYPVMLKARSGGGGRGIRLIENDTQMELIFPRRGRKASPPLEIPPCIWKSMSILPATWRCRSSPTSSETWCAWGSGTAPSSGGTRSSSRNPPLRRFPRSSGPR